MNNFCYHSCGYNLFRYVNIMNHGILSANAGISINGFITNLDVNDSFNGKNNVSVAIPNKDYDNDNLYSSLKAYILDGGISFYIEDVKYKFAINSNSNSRFYDEGYVYNKIPKSHIKGIIINSHIRYKKISTLPIIDEHKTALGSVVANAYAIINVLNDFGINVPEDIYQIISQYNEASIKQKKTIITDINHILSKSVEEYFQKALSKKDITLMNVISYYNNLNLPIYTEDDVKKQCEGCLLPDSVMNRLHLMKKSLYNRFAFNALKNALKEGIVNDDIAKANMLKTKDFGQKRGDSAIHYEKR